MLYKGFMQKCKKLYHDESGTMIIEASVAIVVILAVFLTCIYFTQAYRAKIVMEMAAREGARSFQISQDISDTYKELSIGNIKKASVSSTEDGVRIIKHYDIKIPIVGDHLFNLNVSASYHNENQVLYYEKGASSKGYTGNPY